MSAADKAKMNDLEQVIIQADAPSNPSSGTLMWYKVLSTES